MIYAVLVIAVLLKIIMKRRFSIIQWEALALLLIGISLNQICSLPEGPTTMGLPVVMGAYIYTFIFVTVPSLASVFHEYALKSQYDTSIYLQNLFIYGYDAIFNFLGILGTVVIQGPESFDIFQGQSKATMLLIINIARQGILSSFFFKYAGKIITLIIYDSAFKQLRVVNYVVFFSPLSDVKEEENGVLELESVKKLTG
ncbi:putative nucleotide-sugar transporter [Helianthus anomalus]